MTLQLIQKWQWKDKKQNLSVFKGAPSLCLLFAFTNCQFTETHTHTLYNDRKRKNENTNNTYMKLVSTDKSSTRKDRGTATRRDRGTATSSSSSSSSPSSSTELPAKRLRNYIGRNITIYGQKQCCCLHCATRADLCLPRSGQGLPRTGHTR